MAPTAVVAFCDEAPVAHVLHRNQEASGGQAWIGKLTLKLNFMYEGPGLKGETSSVVDVRTGAFIDSYKLGPVPGANGFDGTHAWMRDISGTVTPEAGGDAVQLAVNEAYRNSHTWWQKYRGGARIELAAPKQLGVNSFDILTITPVGGKRFEAWFDSRTHLLVRIVERQGFQLITTIYGDYRTTEGAMIAHKMVIDDGTGPDGLQTQTLLHANFGPAQPASFYREQPSVPHDAFINGGASQTTVPFELLNNHIYVQVKVNGKGPFRFIVDTGGHDIVMPHLAQALGLHVDGQIPASGAGRQLPSPVMRA
jgi:Aspartyl protease